MRYFAVLLALLLALAAACGSDGEEAASPSPTGTAARTSPATRSPAASPTVPPALDTPAPTPTPMRTPIPAPARDAPLFIALGDSLSAGIGASDITGTSFVPLVHQALGPSYGLLNLGVSGDTSSDLLNHGPLDRAIAEIQGRANDGLAGNEVAAITLEIGGNDLLDLYFSLVIPGTCPTVAESLERPQCVQALQDALSRYEPNLQQILQRLRKAAPQAPLFLMTLYNPFSGGISVLDELGELSLEGIAATVFPEGLNDIIRRQAAATGVHLVEWYPLFEGKQSQYISGDFIHPNDAGHRVMADAIIAAMAQAGLPAQGS